MEEKILEILVGMQKDIKDMKGDIKELKTKVEHLEKDVKILKQDVKVLKQENKSMKENIQEIREEIYRIRDDQRLININVARILEEQLKMNDNFRKHERTANIRYKEFDYRLAKLEA